jgi:hypothetical protein
VGLRDELDTRFKEALKRKDKDTVSVIRLLRAAVKKREIDLKRQLTDEEIVKVIKRQLKQRQEAAETFRKAQREDLATKEQKEAEILQAFLPE